MRIHARLLLVGFVGWLAVTILLRIRGEHLLQPDDWKRTLAIYAISFPLLAWIVRGVCVRLRLPRDQWLAAAMSMLLPTLLLDPFSSAFFPVVFPNMAPQVAGVFGGWMLWCCAGVLIGAALHPPNQP